MTTDNLKIITTTILALALLGLVPLHVATLEQSFAGIALLLVPSGGEALATRIRALISNPPPKGPSVLGKDGDS